MIARPHQPHAAPHGLPTLPPALLDEPQHLARALWDHARHDPMLGIWSLRRDLTLSYANRAAAALYLNLVPDDILNRCLIDLVPRPAADLAESMLQRFEQGERAVHRTSVWQGRRLRSTWTALPKPLADGSVAVIVAKPYPRGLETLEAPIAPDEGTSEPAYVHLGHFERLSRRELEVLAYVGEGLRTADIARTLCRSERTVERHRETIAKKLGLDSGYQLLMAARDAGITPAHAQLPRVRFRQG